MKIRLVQAGFQSFSGSMGSLVFQDGLSTTDVPERDFLRMSAVMSVEREDGSTEAPIDALLKAADTGAPTDEAARAAELASNAEALSKQPEADQAPAAPVVKAVGYTEADLAAVADKEGIKGLRKIADPMGIKGNSIKELIREILEAGA